MAKRDPFAGGAVVYLPISRGGDKHPPGYLGTVTERPLRFQVTSLAPANYLIVAKATDSGGATVCAAERLLRLNAPPVVVLARGPLLPVALDPKPIADTLTLDVRGNEELAYAIETSTDLVHWTPCGSIHLSPRSLHRTLRIAPEFDASGRRFYRAAAK